MTPDLTAQIADILVPAAGTLVTALVSWIAAEAARYVRARTKNEAVANAMDRLCHTVTSAVALVERLVKPQAIADMAHGKLSDFQQKRLRAMVRTIVKTTLTPKVLKDARLAVADLDGFMNARIERSLIALKRGEEAD